MVFDVLHTPHSRGTVSFYFMVTSDLRGWSEVTGGGNITISVVKFCLPGYDAVKCEQYGLPPASRWFLAVLIYPP
jgi:hypothetical protein